MGAGQSHDHSHRHSHGPASHGAAFAIGVALNLAFVVVEATYGFLSGSMALVADAGHNLSDVLSLALAWGASVLARPLSHAASWSSCSALDVFATTCILPPLARSLPKIGEIYVG